MSGFSVVILTRNEEKNILDCIESLPEASEILIVDDYSTDRTVEVVKSLKRDEVKIFRRKVDLNFSDQRNYALSKAENEWVLFVDADERVSSSLASEINSATNSEFGGFYIKRKDILWGKELNHGETGDIKLLRFAKKSSGKWVGAVHEVWEINGRTDTFASPLVHYPHPTVREFLREVDFYSTLRAKELYHNKTNVNLLSIISYPKAKFVVNYFAKLGFLDGIPGFVLAVMMSLHSFLVRSKLWLLNNSQPDKGPKNSN